MQMKMKLKTTGEGRKLPGAGKHGCGRQRWWKVAVTASVFSFLPSYLLCFSSQPPLSSVFSVVFSFSPLSLWGRQRRSGGALWRWRGSAVAVVVVLLLWYFFSSSVTSCSSPLLWWLPFLSFFFGGLRWWRWGGIAMAESRHRGCGDQCCCFPSSSQCYSKGRKIAAGGDDDGWATVFAAVVFLSSLLLFLFLLCFVWFFLSLLPRVCLFSSPLCFLFFLFFPVSAACFPLLSKKFLLPLFVFLCQKNHPPWFPFSFSSPPHSVSLAPVFIGSRGEVHHTLYKHRAWWPGHGSSAFRHGGGMCLLFLH